MNKFVKGAKNLVLGLSFVSVCACSSVENADLNAVNKEFGPREKGNVNGNKHIILRKIDEGVISGNVNNGGRENVNNGDSGNVNNIKKDIIKEFILKNNKVDFDLIKTTLEYDLKDFLFFIDSKGDISYDKTVVCSLEVEGILKFFEFIDRAVDLGSSFYFDEYLYAKLEIIVGSGNIGRGIDLSKDEAEKLVSSYIEKFKQYMVKSCIKNNKINFDLLKKFRLDLSKCNFFVSKNNKILCDEKEIFDFSNFRAEFVNLLEMIVHINEYKGVLQFEEGFEKIKVKVGDNVFSVNEIEFGNVESCVRFICILGLIGEEVFNKLFVCEKLEISNGNINDKTFNLFWGKLNDSVLTNNVDSDKLLNLKCSAFLDGFSLLFWEGKV